MEELVQVLNALEKMKFKSFVNLELVPWFEVIIAARKVINPDLYRVDPIGCGCTDCITGWSKPLDQCNNGELWLLNEEIIQDATGRER